MSENRRRRPRRLSGLLASAIPSLVLVPVLLVVPAALPLCDMDLEACAVDAPVVPAGAHCALAALGEAAGLGAMACCVQDAVPQGPAPAAPAKADADLRVQLESPVPAAVRGALAAPGGAAPAHLSAAAPAAPAVPLYTLLSTLLS